MLVKTNKQFFYFCPKRLKQLLISLLFIVIGIFLLPRIAYFSDITSQNLIELTNQERIKIGASALTANQLLAKAAYLKAQEIFQSQTFQHNIDDKKFSTWIKEAGYSYSYVGENLAIDFVTSKGVVNAWLNSPTHKKNLLNPYFSEIGIATVEEEFQGKNATLVVQIFGAPPKNIVQLYSSNETLNYIAPSINQPVENLLTHSIASIQNPNHVPKINNKFTLNQTALTGPKSMNKFFEHYIYLASFVNYFIIAISTLLVFTLFYLYFYSFSRVSKLVRSTS